MKNFVTLVSVSLVSVPSGFAFAHSPFPDHVVIVDQSANDLFAKISEITGATPESSGERVKVEKISSEATLACTRYEDGAALCKITPKKAAPSE